MKMKNANKKEMNKKLKAERKMNIDKLNKAG